MIKEFGRVLELVVTKGTHGGFNYVKWICYDITVELILPFGIDERFVVKSRQTDESCLHLVDELLKPRMEVERLVVHHAVDLTDPLDQSGDPGNAVVPPGDPLVEEDHHVDGITLGRDWALGNIASKLEVFLHEYWLQLGVGKPCRLGGELAEI